MVTFAVSISQNDIWLLYFDIILFVALFMTVTLPKKLIPRNPNTLDLLQYLLARWPMITVLNLPLNLVTAIAWPLPNPPTYPSPLWELWSNYEACHQPRFHLQWDRDRSINLSSITVLLDILVLAIAGL